MNLSISKNDLKLKYPFSISRHTYYTQPNIVIKLHHEGYCGYGEATINPYYNITIENLQSTFLSIQGRLEHYDFQNPDQLFDDFSDFLPINSFALAALNNASWDLYGKMLGKPILEFIDLPKGNSPQTSYTLGIDSKEKMLEKMKALPWPIYKIKLGTAHDIELLEYLKKHTQSIFRVDANCAWSTEETIENARVMKELNVEFIEQPLPKDDPDQKVCFEKSILPLIADESCCIESDVENCLGNFHGINIKLLKCGGISPALRMIKKSRELKLKIMIGCMTETSIGISAVAQLLPFVDYADLDGPLLLAEDLAEGLSYKNGNISISESPGLGINLTHN